jgi:hypothetical protein
MKFTIEQRVFIVETFARKKTYRKCIRKFRCEYPDSRVPTKLCVSKLVKKWRTTGSVCDIKKQSKRIVLTELCSKNLFLQLAAANCARWNYSSNL